MSAAKKKKARAKAAPRAKAAEKDLVLGLGATGLSVARYLQRAGRDAVFLDSREEPPTMASPSATSTEAPSWAAASAAARPAAPEPATMTSKS